MLGIDGVLNGSQEDVGGETFSDHAHIIARLLVGVPQAGLSHLAQGLLGLILDIEGVAVRGIGVEETSACETPDPLISGSGPRGSGGSLFNLPDGSGRPRGRGGRNQTGLDVAGPGVLLGASAVSSSTAGLGLDHSESGLDTSSTGRRAGAPPSIDGPAAVHCFRRRYC